MTTKRLEATALAYFNALGSIQAPDSTLAVIIQNSFIHGYQAGSRAERHRVRLKRKGFTPQEISHQLKRK